MKDAYYFSHDANAKDDPKCVLLIEQLGLEGYGIYWMLVETLRDQPNYQYPINLLPALARRYNTTTEKVKTVVGNYGLFEIENDMIFFSHSLNRRMADANTKRQKLSEAGRRGNEIRWRSGGDNLAIPEQSQVKESKVKEIKESNIDIEKKPKRFISPSISDVQIYISEHNYTVDAESFVDYYLSNGWKVGSNPMKDWKAAVRNWHKKNKQSNNRTNETEYILPI